MRKTGLIELVGLCVFLGLCSCSGGGRESDTAGPRETVHDVEPAEAHDPARDIAMVRGHYTFGHETRSLVPCGAGEPLWVVERTNLLQELHAELAPGIEPYEEIFVAVAGRTGPPSGDGFAADFAEVLTVEEVIYAAGEGFGCDFDWDGFLYRAQGNEPFWTLVVQLGEMRLVRPGLPDRTWGAVNESRTGDAVTFRGAGQVGPPVELVIAARPSRDSMSGAYYALTARLVHDGQTLAGTALRGGGG